MPKLTFVKWIAISLLLYTLIAGLLIDVPDLPIIRESIRNLFFHVCMWFSMIAMFGTSMIFSIKYLRSFSEKDDIIASEAVKTGILFGILGLTTGMIWAKNTWGSFWTSDPLLNGAAVTMLVYLAYTVLRNSMDESTKKARVSAVYNIFAFVILILFLFILPRTAESSLHPGKGKDAQLTVKELDNTMRFVFYPAILGWISLGFWILNLRIRIKHLENMLEDHSAQS